MSSELAVKVEGLSKCYHIYDKPRDRLLQMLARGRKRFYREFWALRNISLEIRRGETVGIVGRNGSGKSTLLQLICGTVAPSAGRCEIWGKMSALLELGAGFNPQFTGLENIYLLGQVMGEPRSRIDKLLPEIIAFADIGDFINQPLKTYSSGMMVRLAFAVSAFREPEILVVDEALAVGDEAFRRKCFARFEALREKGTTILFVSHAAALVVELCDRALLLDAGELFFDGKPKETIAHYNKLLFAPENRRAQIRQDICAAAEKVCSGPRRDIPDLPGGTDKNERARFIEGLASKSRMELGPQGAVISDPHIETLAGERVNLLVSMHEYQYCYRVRFTKTAYQVQFGMLAKTVSGLEIGGAAHPGVKSYLPKVCEGEEFQARFSFRCLFNPGTFFLNAGVVGAPSDHSEPTYLHRILDAVMFKVNPYKEQTANALVNFDILSVVTKIDE